MVTATVRSRVDPNAPGQEEIYENSVDGRGAIDGSNVKTSKTGEAMEIARLCRSVIFSEKQLAEPRSRRRKFIGRYAGPNYANADPAVRDPLNLLYSLVETLVPALAVAPRATATAADADLGPFAETLRLAIDDELKKMKLAAVLKDAATDALFGMGVTKTGLAGQPGFNADGQVDGSIGPVFCDCVSFDDYIVDMTVKNRKLAQYEGNRYWISADEAIATGFDRGEVARLIDVKARVDANADTGDLGAAGGDERADNEFIPRLQMVDLYLPDRRQLVTIPGDVWNPTGKYINAVDWDGDPSGPFDTFGFSAVPDHMLPLPVIAAIFDLYVLINKIGRKVGRQADRQKDIIGYQLGGEGDGEAARDSADGQLVGFENLDSVRPMSFGGASDDGFKAVAWLQDFLNHTAGNTDLLGGLKADSNTAAQDQMQLANAAGRVNEWLKTMHVGAGSIIRKVGQYVWEDDETARELMLVLGAGDEAVRIPRIWTADGRDGSLEDYDIDIDANRRPAGGPDEAYGRTHKWITEILANPQVQNAAAAQGMALDVRKIAQITAAQLGVENADEMFVAVDPDRTTGPQAAGGSMHIDNSTKIAAGRPRQNGGPGASAAPRPQPHTQPQQQTAPSGQGE